MKTERDRIGDALYMLAAGANQTALMDTLRAFVVVHSKTPDDVSKLLRDLAKSSPSAFANAMQGLATERDTDMRRMFAEMDAKLAPLLAHAKNRKAGAPKSKPTKAGTKQRGSRSTVSRLD